MANNTVHVTTPIRPCSSIYAALNLVKGFFTFRPNLLRKPELLDRLAGHILLSIESAWLQHAEGNVDYRYRKGKIKDDPVP